MFMTIVLILTVLSAAGVTYALGGFHSWAFLVELPLFLILFYFLFVALTLAAIYLYGKLQEDLEQPARENPKMRRLVDPTVRFIFQVLRVKFQVSGMEKLPKEGRMMLVCNHISILDPLSLHRVFPKSQLAFISKQENNKLPIVNSLMHGTNCQMLNRENDREALTVILRCIDILKEDAASIAVFPEGYTSLNGHLQPYRNGVFKIAQRAKVPVVVCTLEGTRDVFQNFLHLRSSVVKVDLLQVIPVEELKGTTKELGDRVHVLMEQNLGFWGTPMLEGARKVDPA